MLRVMPDASQAERPEDEPSAAEVSAEAEADRTRARVSG
jgi:hypothetical protein